MNYRLANAPVRYNYRLLFRFIVLALCVLCRSIGFQKVLQDRIKGKTTLSIYVWVILNQNELIEVRAAVFLLEPLR